MATEPMPRRTFLKAGGVALALPLLDVMAPARAGASAARPARLVNVCATLGLYADAWFPNETGADYEASEYLALLDAHRHRYTLFSGLAHANQSGRQAHNSEITWLTSAEHPGLDGFRNTISLDQAVADHLGYVTRYPSIVLGTVSPQSQSYTKNGVMVPAEISPATVFRKLFLQGDAAEVAQETQRLQDGGSILDGLKAQAAALRGRASVADRHKLTAYYEAVRAAEQELTEVRAWLDRPKPTVAADPPTDLEDKADLIGRVALMLKLIPLMLQTDSSRVASLMIQDHGVVVKVPGVTGEHHGLSHHGQDEAKIAQLKKVEARLVASFGEFLDRLSEADEQGATLLDTTTVLFGSNLGNANSHSATALPILVAGGPFSHGQHIALADVPLSNLFVTLLRTVGAPAESFGHSTGALTWG